MSDFTNDEKDLLNKIKHNKSSNINFFDKDLLESLHQGVVNKTFRINPDANKNKPNVSQKPKVSNNQNQNKSQSVIEADKMFRESVKRLYLSLLELGDKEAARRLIGEHILMLNDIFKEFE
ncbi:MAG: hypothetical protein A2086_07520 [Spirochaetes bacterium GWD1_27_9]|nr:MAG: hypothetical protein A2Z98_18165 [Spirochaetes bacterium GWB1_27_13]OHD27955.1 MAG: hypothetical protein A2Y34_13355 [Spirochaetes bacterium GWC1_27_15]OHD44781.1 MAG: hypothetical protein A2086_07520 [Spirochaetes bacterium GWD1_27_9]